MAIAVLTLIAVTEAAATAGARLLSPAAFTGAMQSPPSFFQNGTVPAATCGRDDVQRAIDIATDGQIVLIPAGTCIWTSGVIVTGKGIYLKGQTDFSTHLQFAAGSATLMDITKDDTHHVAVGYIDFQYLSGSGVYLAVRGVGQAFLVHDNHFDANASMFLVMHIFNNGGVIWSNTITNGDTVNGNYNGVVQLKMPLETSSWTTPTTFGANDTNGTANTYLEDNTFTRTLVQSFDCDDNARVVFRYNVMNDAAGAMHGADSSPIGCRQWEVYNNTFHRISDSYPINRWLYVRGASGVSTDNTFDEAGSPHYPNKIEIELIVQNLRRSAGPYPCCTTYPCPHQVGQSTDTPDSTPDEPVAVWNNSGTGATSSNFLTPTNYFPDECGGGPDVSGFIQSGRDYITSPKPGYTKYPYPHPLRAGA